MPDEPLRDFLTHSVTEAYGEPLEAAPALAARASLRERVGELR